MEIRSKKEIVFDTLKHNIISGTFTPGEKLPSGLELAEQLGVSHITMRSALDRLAGSGYIVKIHGRGIFVNPDAKESAATSTIMIVRDSESGVERPWNYIVPEMIRYMEKNNLKDFITTNDALEFFSNCEISSFVKANNIIGIAAVISNFNGTELILEKLRAAEVPVVITHCRMSDPEITGFAGIAIPEKDGWDAGLAYLAECGHKNIAIIGNAASNKRRLREHSMQELLDQMQKCGVASNPELIEMAIFDREDIKAKVKKLMALQPRPSAILCFSDFFAIYVYDALKELNLRIPEDVAVLGTCGYPDARLLSPPLSSIDYEYAKMAEMTVEMLQNPDKWFDPITGKGKLRMKPFKLRKRQSTESK
ncbi:MAG: substrate-binding domain-containing protein [Victivallaceae bacterium]